MTSEPAPPAPNEPSARETRAPGLSRSQLVDILEGFADGVIVQTPKGRWLFANEAAARLIGYPTPGDLLRASVGEVLARFEMMDERGEPFPATQLPARTAMRGETSAETLIGFRTHGAPEVRWSLVNARPVLTPKGRVKFVVSTFRDVSETVRATAALQASEERYRRLVDLLPDAVAVHQSGRISFANPAALSLMGVSSQEALLDKRVLDFVHPDFHALASRRMSELEAGQTAAWTEQQMVRPDGSVLDVEVAATPLPDEHAASGHEAPVQGTGDPDADSGQRAAAHGGAARRPSVLVVVRDITERKRQAARLQQSRDELALARDELEQRVIARTGQLQRALEQVEIQLAERAEVERALRESEMQFRSVAESASEAIIIADKNGRIVYWNSGAMQIFGYHALEMLAQPLGSLMPERYRALHERGLARVRETGRGRLMGRTLALNGLRKDGGEFPLELSLASWHSGEMTYFSGIIRDTTERKRNEERLEAAQRQLRDLTAHLQTAREQERAAIARELHDELAQILIVAKLEISRLAKEVERHEGAGAPARLQAALEGLAETINDSVQSIRAIVSELRPPMLDNLGLEAAMDWQVQQFQERSGIESKFAADVSSLQMDPGRSLAMFRILQESLTNIMRHARATRVEVSLRVEGDQLCLEVRDNGVGISGGDMQKANHFGVIGMRERIALLGGDINIRGAPGEGTVVEVRAPLAPAAQADGAQA